MSELSASAHWPAGSVTDLIGGPLLTPQTSAALRARLAPIPPPERAVLDTRQLGVLAGVAARLVPQDRPDPVDIAATFHARLAAGQGDGWRYADLPPDAAMVAHGLDALAAAGFVDRDAAGRDALLAAVKRGEVEAAAWGVSPIRWFEEVLTALVDLYYSHPFAQAEIGFAGMADARGWPAVGFDARAGHEPQPTAAR